MAGEEAGAVPLVVDYVFPWAEGLGSVEADLEEGVDVRSGVMKGCGDVDEMGGDGAGDEVEGSGGRRARDEGLRGEVGRVCEAKGRVGFMGIIVLVAVRVAMRSPAVVLFEVVEDGRVETTDDWGLVGGAESKVGDFGWTWLGVLDDEVVD